MKGDKLIENLTLEEIKKIVNEAPKFIQDSIRPHETMYNPRTKKYIERGLFSVMIQLTEEEDFCRSTMAYDSSFYDECILLDQLRDYISRKKDQH